MSSPITILTHENGITPRLKYVLNWIFTERLKVPFQLISNPEQWEQTDTFKINYSGEELHGAHIRIKPQGLLSENQKISTQNLSIQRWKKTTVLFYNQPGGIVPFDLFAAVFYLISRYEEYLPHKTDKHGRFSSSASAAGQYHFLGEPVIDQWLFHFKELLKKEGVIFPEEQFQFRISFDVDMAWKYRYRGNTRYWGGQIRDILKFNFKEVKNRFLIAGGKKPDPFYSFPLLEQLDQKFRIAPIFFILLGKEGRYDRNIPGSHPEMQKLIRQLAEKHEVGIHPSYGSHEDTDILKQEIHLLSTLISKPITQSRQHFIKFTLPDTFQNLLKNDIKEDYSMGYADCNGFRAGTSHAFPWYDLSHETTTGLIIHPFAFMDATSRFYLKQSPEDALKEWQRLFNKIQTIQGTFVSIWHNYILSLDEPWISTYQGALEFLSYNPKILGNRNI